MNNYKLSNMINEQIIARGITDQKIINAFYAVDRSLFVPNELKEYAYDDNALPIGHGQTISQPYIVAFMTNAAQLDHDCKVLEIGTGSGYQAAILSKLCKEVYTVEIVRPLLKRAQLTFEKLGFRNIHSLIVDGYQGWLEHAPYDAIIATAASESIPNTLYEQLKVGGRLVIPVGKLEQKLLRITRYVERPIIEELEYVRFVPMIHPED